MPVNSPTKQYVRLVTLERPTAWVIVAVLMEARGNGEEIAVSEPRVVKIIPRKVAATLSAGVSKPGVSVDSFLLASGAVASSHIFKSVLSPFVNLFSSSESYLIPWVTAIPPTN